MLDAILKRVALELIVGAVRHPDEAVRRELVRLYFDLKYLYLFGFPKIPVTPWPGPFPPEPQPDPTPVAERLRLYDDLLFELVMAVTDDGADPTPQPSVRALLKDRSIQLEAAKSMAQRLELGLKQVQREANRLVTVQAAKA